ncbi:MAG: 30S ribosomal protein S17e [Thermoplasmata archaeon]|nr:30S ribosomal protein S17e [Thermoplasmata archaeon]
MGRIRPTFIKRTAMELANRYPKLFTTDFETNKRIVKEIADIDSKEFINKVAGYITHYQKILQREKENQ